MLRTALLWLILAANVLAQGGPLIAIGETFKLRSDQLKEDRTLLLSLPQGYATSAERYPVLYLLDGDAHFTHTRGTVEFLSRSGLMPDLIIVGIPNTQRTRDLTPTVGKFTRADGSKGTTAGSGGGEAFLDFLEQTVIPHVEARFRTQPYRILAGHSFGGLLALHAMATRPHLFQGIISASPSLAWDEDQLLRQLETFFRSKPALKATLFVSIADEEAGAPRPNRFDRLNRLLRGAKVGEAFTWEARAFPDEDHGSVVLRSHYWGFRKLFEGWRLPADAEIRRFQGGLKELKAHFEKLSKRMGYSVLPSEFLLNNVGYQVLGRNNGAGAVAIFRYGVALYPTSPNVYDSLGEALEGEGKKEEALDCYAKAVALAEPTKDPRLATYRRNQERLAAVHTR